MMRENIAKQFGDALDHDNFEVVSKLLSAQCEYYIGDRTLSGREEICQSYEQNMKEGRVKLDKLEWGKSKAESISESECFVHFTDYLTHKGISYIHRCTQKLTIDHKGQIIRIDHLEDKEEQRKLKNFYRSVDLMK